MEQHFAVVGPGRAGASFAAALPQVGWTCDGVFGRSDDISGLADRTGVVLITVPDDAIAEVAASIEPGSALLVHVSGAKPLGVLEPHRHRASVHPLMSLPDAETGAERLLDGGVFAIAGDPRSSALVSALGGRSIEVGDDRRALYHATAAVAANHLVALCAQVERLASEVGVPVDAYWALMTSTLDNVRRSGAVSSLTGPAARGDESTLAAHLESLPPDEHALYVTLANEAAALAGTTLSPNWDQPDETA